MTPSRVRAVAIASLGLLSLLFWKLRIVDTGVSKMLTFYSADLYTQHAPMTEYAFSALREGRLPLWNPWQLCGEPFLAIPYVGVFYPINLLYLFLSVPAGIEVDTIVHLTIGLLGMWALMRHFGVSHLAAVTAAVTFAWAGWLVYNVNQPSLFAGLNWMPWTVLGIDALACGAPFAWLAVLLLVALQVLRGSVEILIHALMAAALFAGPRLLVTWRRHGLGAAVRRGALLGGAIAGGLALAAIQIMPTSELVSLSSRVPGTRLMSYEVARAGGIDWGKLALAAVATGEVSHVATTGLFPILAAVLALGTRRRLLACAAAFGCVALGVALIPGGEGYRLYHSLPIIGNVFRRPMKFLDICSLGSAILVGLGVARLQEWRNAPARDLLRQPALLGALLLASVVLFCWPWSSRLAGLAFALLTALIAVYVALPWRRERSLLVAAICVVQAGSLFFSVRNVDIRPLWRTDTFQTFRPALRPMLELPRFERTYLFPALHAPLGWNVKQGMLNRFGVAQDYEALLDVRYADYFNLITPTIQWIEGFQGLYDLQGGSLWPLMLATGTRYFATLANSPADALLASGKMPPNGPSFRLVKEGPVRLYAADAARPRVYVVGRARRIEKPRGVTNAMRDPRAYGRREVLLENAPASLPAELAGEAIHASAEITAYEPEHVAVHVETDGTGMLVLTDLFYPGWQAFVGDDEVPIYRGNYLFRSIVVPAGRHDVRFEYRPASFRRGLAVSAITAIAVGIAAAVGWRRRRLWRLR